MSRSIGELFSKVVTHARQGTLFSRLWQGLRGAGAGAEADPDHYRGDVARGYLEKRLQQKSWHAEQDIVRDLLATVPDGSSVLDIAVGTGRFVEMYHRKNMSVSGIDISQDMLAEARKVLGAAYDRCDMRLGSAETLPWPDASFDLVVCFRFFGLIPMSVALNVLREIGRVARRSVIIRVPVLREGESAVPLKPNEPVQGRLAEPDLLRLFTEHGFAVRQTRLVEDTKAARFTVYLLEKTAAAARAAG
jgi:ubiquinone/menaquinone biosynthesis C-methylase UbiE